MVIFETDDLVSVIIPVRNAERFIERTLQSVMAQSHQRLEIIVVDDGSTDGTPDIVEAHARKDGRIRVIKQETRGPAAARNTAAAAARGSFLAPCDSDDLWHPEKIARQLAILQAAPPETGVVYCWSVGLDEEDGVIFPDWARKSLEGEVLYAMIEDNLPGSGSASLIRRAFFNVVGGYPEDRRYGEEWQFYIALAGVCRFAVVRAQLVGYRIRLGSMTSDFRGVAQDLARTTLWIVCNWPATPVGVLRRRAYIVNRYLAFLAVRQRCFVEAFRYRAIAWAAQPTSIFSLATLDFFLMVIGGVLGVTRYYHCFWRRPLPWQAVRDRGRSGPMGSSDASLF